MVAPSQTEFRKISAMEGNPSLMKLVSSVFNIKPEPS